MITGNCPSYCFTELLAQDKIRVKIHSATSDQQLVNPVIVYQVSNWGLQFGISFEVASNIELDLQYIESNNEGKVSGTTVDTKISGFQLGGNVRF